MDIKLMPSGGINNVSDVTMLKTDSLIYLKDAVNVDVSAQGTVTIRKSGTKLTDNHYRYLWQSPLHGDVFALHEGNWVKVNTADWSHEILAINVGDGPIYHEVLNNKVIVSAKFGIYVFDGQKAQPLAIDTPAIPMITHIDGSLPAGDYQVAIAWMREDTESALSEISFNRLNAQGGLSVVWAMPIDTTITGVRIYLSHGQGMNLQLVETLPIDLYQYDIAVLPKLGRVSQFKHLSPMPAGRYLRHWQGRLWQARANIIRFSEALAYHLHDERHGFIQMPQAITFLEPVDGGIWVGQRDHVAFLQGTNPGEFALIRKTQQAPIEGSAVRMNIETSEQSTGAQVVVWLSSVGYMAGMPDGSVLPYQSKNLQDISAAHGNSVRFNKRVITTVS